MSQAAHAQNWMRNEQHLDYGIGEGKSRMRRGEEDRVGRGRSRVLEGRGERD